MITWEEAKRITSKRMPVPAPMPDKIPIYYAYKNGTCTTFDDPVEARKFSKLVETSCSNKIERETIKQAQQLFNNEVMNIWMDELKQEYNDLVKYGIFEAIYIKAYEDGHAYGMDEVANKMESLVNFIEEEILPPFTSYLQTIKSPN